MYTEPHTSVRLNSAAIAWAYNSREREKHGLAELMGSGNERQDWIEVPKVWQMRFSSLLESDDEYRSIAAIDGILIELSRSQNLDVFYFETLPFIAKGETFTADLDALWWIFVAAKTDPHCGDVGCVLDCLDECEESTRKGLIELMVRLQTSIRVVTPRGIS
ncbi:hypothetical protein BZA05DRAFT_422597 [Tricharina praecox]|uniref:uncharacterized protein n=1 Tax=Tricharina praecox TaxID=43433 RepID=UPI00221ED85D|nr:uncharacterized protein BZA05DRAFT_422597 [Tricharina praecox]KAI5842254.1 hypothetical protein BZA05DRAFT_422597 [Tricharina praecox]